MCHMACIPRNLIFLKTNTEISLIQDFSEKSVAYLFPLCAKLMPKTNVFMRICNTVKLLGLVTRPVLAQHKHQ